MVHGDRQPIVERSIAFAVKFISWVAEYKKPFDPPNLGASPANTVSSSVDTTVVETSSPFLVRFFKFLFKVIPIISKVYTKNIYLGCVVKDAVIRLEIVTILKSLKDQLFQLLRCAG